MTLARPQAPAKATLLLPSRARLEMKKITKDSWAEIRTGKGHASNAIRGKTGST